MVDTLASRIAGLKLTWIIAVLLVPFAVLSFLTTTTIREEIAFAERAQSGLQVNRKLFPLALSLQKSLLPRADVIRELNGLLSDSNDKTSSEKLNLLTKLASDDEFPDTALSKEVLKLVPTLSVDAGMLADNNMETTYLTTLAARSFPDLLVSLADMRKLAETQKMDPASKPGAAIIFQSLGKLRSTFESMQSTINEAAATSNRDGTYEEFNKVVRDIDKQVKATAAELENASIDTLPIALANAPSLNADFDDVVATIGGGWAHATTHLSNVLTDRVASLNQKLRLIVAVALAATALGLGSAVAMFRSSLRRLDELKISKLAAEGAQQDSEDMNRRLTTINNEIVHLNQELADKMRRLKDAQDELLKRGRLEQLGQLTATVAHEMRNPLGAVRTSAFLLERKIKDKGLGVESQLQRINNGIKRCDSIITQLLDFSRTKQIDAVPADLDDWLIKTVEEEAKKLPAVVAVECNLTLESESVPFDAARLQRAVINLIANAAEAMVGTGEDPSKYAVKNPILSVSTFLKDGHAVLAVTDNGPGISADIIEKIREPLFTTKSFGTGLGIPAVEQIASQHGGRLEITSTVGQGASFKIFLPMVQKTEQVA